MSPALLAVIVLAGCGSGLTAHPAASSPRSSAPGPTATATPTTRTSAPASSPDKTVTVTLQATTVSSRRPRRGHASLSATLRILGSQGKLCWTFGHVSGLTSPTSAHINQISPIVNVSPDVAYNPSDRVFVTLGPRYGVRGCTGVSQVIVSQLEGLLGNFYLAVDSAEYPNDALRAHL